MKKLVGLFVSTLFLTSLLAGCSKAPAENETLSATNNVSASASSGNTQNENEPTSQNEDAQANSEVSTWPRTYVDALGNEIILEKQPERVISVFHAMYPDYLYAYDTYPIGAAFADNLLNKWAAFKDYTSEHPVVDIGSPMEPNLEKILELEPDLILAASFHENVYGELSKIAPTIILDYTQINTDWKYGVEEFAKLLGKENQTDKIIANVENSIADGSDNLKNFRAKNESVVFISVTEKEIWPYTVSQLQVIYNETNGLGLKAPEAYASITDSSSSISLEALSEYNPDHIFLMTDYGDDTAAQWLEELKSNSVWNSISAFQKNNIYLTDRSIFAFNSPIATQYGINFVVESLVE